ncbi:unnamed protein product [Oikopleura dioica]|uniref:Neurotransmitter-gated ion-channel ligand-binding domain-containing protein n=1 Tax=Oikopleura dioica TaxID=34765 RepID=E4Y6W4_OIKDI|nr:unnamed protein product [Oikopleura dioica]
MIFLLLFQFLYLTNASAEADIYEKIKYYDKRIRPYEKERPTGVRVSYHIPNLDSVDEQAMDYRLSMFLRMRWKDPRLSWGNNTECKLQVHPDVMDKIWIPDLFFSNEKSARIHSMITNNTLLRVSNHGDVYVSIRLSLVLSCHLLLHRFPLDVQCCKIRAESFGYSTQDVVFEWTKIKPLDMASNLTLPQFTLLGSTYKSCTIRYARRGGNYTCLDATFILRRELGYYLIQMYIPSLLIVVLSWLGFWVNVDSTPARTTLGITTVWTISSMSSSENAASSLPKVSYVKAIDIWLMLCLTYVFAALLEFACANYLSRQSEGILYGRKLKARITLIARFSYLLISNTRANKSDIFF